jgi:hypothetical protein
MMQEEFEFLRDDLVTYTLQHNGKFYLIENVPARVNEDTGEQFFDPATVKHLQQLILEGQTPIRMMEIPVYRYERSSFSDRNS